MGVGKFGPRIEIGFPEDQRPLAEGINEINAPAYHNVVLEIAAQYSAQASIEASGGIRGGRFDLQRPVDVERCAAELALCDSSCSVYVMQLWRFNRR